MPHDPIARLNTIALAIALALLVTLGGVWAWARLRPAPRVVFAPERFVNLVAPTGGTWPAGAREQWLVAVNLRCPHCQQHLRALARRIADRPAPPALGVLLVDQPGRPAEVGFGVTLPAGVWWDSTQVWRQRWRRGAYGETFRFAPDGRLLRATPAGFVPDSLGSRM